MIWGTGQNHFMTGGKLLVLFWRNCDGIYSEEVAANEYHGRKGRSQKSLIVLI